MSQRINRREFSGLLAGGMALLSEAAPAGAQPAGTISVRQTADTKRFAEEPVLKWQPADARMPLAVNFLLAARCFFAVLPEINSELTLSSRANQPFLAENPR